MEITNVAIQEVSTNGNVLFNDTAIPGSKCVTHRDGSGLITLRGITNGQCNARFLVSFGGNIAVPTGETVGEVSLSIAISGEPLGSSRMIVTPAAVDEYFNVSSSAYINVPSGTSYTVAVENTSDIPVNVQNANLIVTRVA